MANGANAPLDGSSCADRILGDLAAVHRERQARAADAEWLLRVRALKRYQQQRFAHTYGDLLLDSRYAAAARFFLDELYGPRDFSERDAQFVRIVPALVRLFPQEVVDTVASLASLHALSESLDSETARHLHDARISVADYVAAWRRTGRAADRERQIVLTLLIGAELDRLTRRPMLRRSLRLMRAPAHAAGLSELQRFLECGFDAFAAMRGATEFLGIVEERERALAHAIFNGAHRDTVASLPADGSSDG